MNAEAFRGTALFFLILTTVVCTMFAASSEKENPEPAVTHADKLLPDGINMLGCILSV